MQPLRFVRACFSPNLQKLDLPYVPAAMRTGKAEDGVNDQTCGKVDTESSITISWNRPRGYCHHPFEVAQRRGVCWQLELHRLFLLARNCIWCGESMGAEGCYHQAGISGGIRIRGKNETIVFVLGVTSDIKKVLKRAGGTGFMSRHLIQHHVMVEDL